MQFLKTLLTVGTSLLKIKRQKKHVNNRQRFLFFDKNSIQRW